MKKRGQFFLAAALIIITILIGIGTIYNSSSPGLRETKTFSLADEIKYEGSQLLDYAVKNRVQQASIDSSLDSLVLNYAKSNPDKEIIVAYGDHTKLQQNNIQLKHYKGSTSLLGITASYQSGPWLGKVQIAVQRDPSESLFYYFNVNKGQNLYVIVIKDNEDERFIATA